MARNPVTSSFALLLTFYGVVAQADTRKPSTPEDRAKAVEIAAALESDPLGKQAKEQRSWIVLWLIGVPDINIKLCGKLLGPLVDSKKNYSTEIFGQLIPSSGAFIIKNPDRAKDNLAVYTAGVEGALRAYESILKTKPKATWPFLDDLIEKRDKGELSEYVRQAAAHCK